MNTLIKRLNIVSLCMSLFARKRSEMEFLAVHFARLLLFCEIFNLNYNVGIAIRFYFESLITEFVTSRPTRARCVGSRSGAS